MNTKDRKDKHKPNTEKSKSETKKEQAPDLLRRNKSFYESNKE